MLSIDPDDVRIRMTEEKLGELFNNKRLNCSNCLNCVDKRCSVLQRPVDSTNVCAGWNSQS